VVNIFEAYILGCVILVHSFGFTNASRFFSYSSFFNANLGAPLCLPKMCDIPNKTAWKKGHYQAKQDP